MPVGDEHRYCIDWPFYYAGSVVNKDDWTYLRDDLLKFAKHDAVVLDKTEYGQLYGVSGPLTGPNGNSGQVLTIWIIMVGTANPRLVTAYPDE